MRVPPSLTRHENREPTMTDPGRNEATHSTPQTGVVTSERGPWWLGYAVALVFVLLAIYFVLSPPGLDIPISATVDAAIIPRDSLSTAPRRAILPDPPVQFIAGFDRTCMDCHRTFPPRDDPPVKLLQHQDIVLDHGINDRCRNCHYDVDRNRLVLHDGSVIGYDQVVELCAKCHGPTYRDWQRRAHGRTNGYWDTSAGEQVRLNCTECHDPHMPRVPAMDPLPPLPGPHTLRMGVPKSVEHLDSAQPRDPLIRALSEAAPHGQEAKTE